MSSIGLMWISLKDTQFILELQDGVIRFQILEKDSSLLEQSRSQITDLDKSGISKSGEDEKSPINIQKELDEEDKKNSNELNRSNTANLGNDEEGKEEKNDGTKKKKKKGKKGKKKKDKEEEEKDKEEKDEEVKESTIRPEEKRTLKDMYDQKGNSLMRYR